MPDGLLLAFLLHLQQVEDSSKMLIAGAPLAVDTFFALGGLLVCFVTLRTLETRRFFNVPHFYLHRYIRYYLETVAIFITS